MLSHYKSTGYRHYSLNGRLFVTGYNPLLKRAFIKYYNEITTNLLFVMIINKRKILQIKAT